MNAFDFPRGDTTYPSCFFVWDYYSIYAVLGFWWVGSDLSLLRYGMLSIWLAKAFNSGSLIVLSIKLLFRGDFKTKTESIPRGLSFVSFRFTFWVWPHLFLGFFEVDCWGGAVFILSTDSFWFWSNLLTLLGDWAGVGHLEFSSEILSSGMKFKSISSMSTSSGATIPGSTS